MIKVLGLLSHSSLLDNEYRVIHGVDYARIINPLLFLDKAQFEVSLRLDPLTPDPNIRDDCDKTFTSWAEVATHYDIILYSYTVSAQWFVQVAFHCEKFGCKLICDIDDNIWEVPERSGAYSAFHPGSHETSVVAAQLEHVPNILTTKQKTAEIIAKHAKIPLDKIFVYPNYIDLSVYKAEKIKRVVDDKIRICYFGTNTHFDDIANNKGILFALDNLMAKYPNLELFTVGFFLPELKNRWKKQYFSMVGDRDVYSWAENLWVKIMSMSDIAVAPLLDSDFTRCKSNIKYLECAVAKVPTVCQRIDQYTNTIKDGVNGFLATTKYEWSDALKALIDSADLRKQIGEAGYDNIVDNHQIQLNTIRMENYLTRVADKFTI